MKYCQPNTGHTQCLKCLKTSGVCPTLAAESYKDIKIDPLLHGKEKFQDRSRIDTIGQNGNDGTHYVDLSDLSDKIAHRSITVSDGSTASYYELPKGARELQDIISYKNMNAQIGEIFRACMRYGEVDHSPEMRDIKKIIFYAKEELKRLENYGF